MQLGKKRKIHRLPNWINTGRNDDQSQVKKQIWNNFQLLSQKSLMQSHEVRKYLFYSRYNKHWKQEEVNRSKKKTLTNVDTLSKRIMIIGRYNSQNSDRPEESQQKKTASPHETFRTT